MIKVANKIPKPKDTAIGVLILLATATGQEITASMDEPHADQEQILEQLDQLEDRIRKLEAVVF